jgi:HPt (histidine-containing phosphotransfer) domain-containing protein
MDGHIKKPIRPDPGEITLGGFSTVPSAVPVEKLLWGKAEALERLGGDEELLRELCQIFLQESPKLLEKLRRAIVTSDAESVMRAAHSLKGELGYLGAARATQAAQELEDMGHDNKLSHATATLNVLEREMAGLHLALTDPAGTLQ